MNLLKLMLLLITLLASSLFGSNLKLILYATDRTDYDNGGFHIESRAVGLLELSNEVLSMIKENYDLNCYYNNQTFSNKVVIQHLSYVENEELNSMYLLNLNIHDSKSDMVFAKSEVLEKKLEFVITGLDYDWAKLGVSISNDQLTPEDNIPLLDLSYPSQQNDNTRSSKGCFFTVKETY